MAIPPYLDGWSNAILLHPPRLLFTTEKNLENAKEKDVISEARQFCWQGEIHAFPPLGN